MKFPDNIFLLACSAMVFALSCSSPGPDSAETIESNSETNAPETAAPTEMAILSDSLSGNWQRMDESDERKMASIKRLLDEISYTPRYNSLRHRQLLQLHERTKTLEFGIKEMQNSDMIDRYDAAQDSLVNGTLNLAAETPEVEKYPLVSELTTDIQQEHNKTILFRIRHDEFGRSVNQHLQKSPNAIKELEAPFSTLQKIPLFSLNGK